MRILFIHNHTQFFGGPDVVVANEMHLLKEKGHTVSIYSRHNDEIKKFGIRKKIQFFPETIFSRTSAKALSRIINDTQPDVAYVHNVFPLISPSAYNTLYKHNIPTVQGVHDFRFICPSAWLYANGAICELCTQGNYLPAIQKKCFRNSRLLSALYACSVKVASIHSFDKIDAFLCPSEFVKRKYIEGGFPSNKLIVKPHFSDIHAITPNHTNSEYALYIGRLSKEKGLWSLIKAFERMPNLSLKICGYGPLTDPIKEYVAKNGTQNITLEGFVEGKKKTEMLQNSSFVIFPSECHESFGLVLLEAFAAGKPVLASRIGSIPNIIHEDKTGLLFEPGNIDDIITKVRHLSEQPERQTLMGHAARQELDSRYSPDACYNILMQAFQYAQNSHKKKAR